MRAMLLALALVTAACGAVEGVPGPDPEKQVEINEGLAISVLRTVASAQVQAQSLVVIDADGDGEGEYGYLSELSGGRNPRAGGDGVKVPFLSNDFRRLAAGGYVEFHGYHFRVYLPGSDGEMIGESLDPAEGVDADSAETTWVCYAWPAGYGVTGRRTFFIDQEQRTRSSEAREYSGTSGPPALAAYDDGEDGSRVASGEWRAVD